MLAPKPPRARIRVALDLRRQTVEALRVALRTDQEEMADSTPDAAVAILELPGAKSRRVSIAVGDNAPAAGFAGAAATAGRRRHGVTGPARQPIPPPLELQWTH
ncbi:MAG: hypothetical protein FAZ92_01277 [Accumulibacter sp.]|nr:MAG: hypothetical protein FAZ92_01277 [Accumulibacter sp.]